MDGPGARPYVATPTATRLIANGLRGLVTLDVTADVRGLSSGGGAQHGWILKKTDDGASGQVDFGSRESATPPRLVLTLMPRSDPADWPVLTSTLPDLDTSRVLQLEGDTVGDTILVYRTDITLRFNVGVSDSAKAAFFERRSMTVIGMTESGRFFVRIPDPGPSPQSFFAALEGLRAEPEILRVTLIPRSPMPHEDFSRLPTDGPGQARADWLAMSSGTWAMRAIRAPLAWGCETGDYGAPFVPVGIFEWKHQPTHPEFMHSVQPLRQPSDADLAKYKPVGQDTVASHEAHAVATTGLLAAAGDNASGIAGMTWRTRLFLYAGYSAGNRKLPLESGLYALVNQIIPDDIRVLSLSADERLTSSLSLKDRQELIGEVAIDVSRLLDRLPSLLIVLGAGNERTQKTVTDYLKEPRPRLLRAALLLLREDAKYRDRIIAVTGTDSGNRFRSQSNFFKGGATDVAAPAGEVRVLARWTGQTGSAVPLTTTSGTSLAAPLVAGVAAQLWAMDSTLTPAQVKRYILRGAQDALSRSSGQAPQPVSGAPETVYQLDAYGALALLSRERSGVDRFRVPICGYPVSARLTTPEGVALERAPGDTGLIPVPGLVALTSVAQGGRQIAVRVVDQATVETRVLDHRGNLLATLPAHIDRYFLERDTADVVGGLLPLPDGFSLPGLVLRRHDGTDTTVRLFYNIPSDVTNLLTPLVAVSPAGDAAATAWGYATGTPPSAFRWELVALPSGAVTTVVQEMPAGFVTAGPGGPPAWSHDGRRVVFPIIRANLDQEFFPTAIRTQLTVLFGGGRTDDTVGGREVFDPRFSPDDSVLHSRERALFAPGGCWLTRRSPVAPHPLVAPEVPLDCMVVATHTPPPEIFPNVRLRPAPVIAADAARVRGFGRARSGVLPRPGGWVQAN